MRTLVISDLHLGALLARDVLRRPQPLEALEAQVAGVDRLVLLGDTIELLDERADVAFATAATVLPRLAAALGREGQVVLVPGNHDYDLVRPWVKERLSSGAAMPPAGRVARRSSPLLDELCRLLAPAHVEVRYPGVWLAPRVYATHGHYIDRHLLAALAAAMRPGRRAAAGEGGSVWLPSDRDGDSEAATAAATNGATRRPARSTVSDYERALGADSGALQELLARSLPEPLGGGASAAVGAVRRAAIASLPMIGAAAQMRGASLIWANLLEHGHARRGALPAMVEVAARLGIAADVVVFGHIHRRGPLPSDPPSMWRPAGGAGPRLLNTGSWVWDAALRGRPDGARPYRPGGAVLIEGERAPRAIDLLAGITDSELGDRE